jgi:sugar lactone lactonase YvrE
MPVSEVRAGMRGYGLTVFRGTTIERFDVEILGVLPKLNNGQSLVLVRLSGGPISGRGAYLIQGMSGSPIYVNGKLLGAFSMGDPWPKEPIGMVTPIEDMLEALDPKLSSTPAGQTAFDLRAPAQDTMLPATGSVHSPGPLPSLFTDPTGTAAGVSAQAAGRIQPLALPVAISGLNGARLDRAAQALRPFNLNVVQGPGSMPQPFAAELKPGAAVGVALMTGDVEMTAIGTITYRKGDQLLAFGHPMMQLGAAQFPITTAWIHDVFSGYQVSHKIGSAGQLCGTLTQDRPFSVAARVGALPEMIPVSYTVTDRTSGRSRSFNVRTANHPLLVAQLLPIAVNQGLFSVRPVPGDAVAHVRMVVETQGAGTIRRENLYFDPMAIDIAAVRELGELMQLLANNSLRRVPVKSLTMEVTLEEKRPTAVVERVFLSQERFEPGEEIEVGAVVRPYRKEPVVLRTKVRVPENAASGRALLLVQGGATRIDLTALSAGASGGGLPGAAAGDTTLGQLVQRFSSRERNDQLVLRLLFSSTGVSFGGQKLSRLPSILVDLMRSGRNTGFRSEREEWKVAEDTPYILQGVQTLGITIQKPDLLERPGLGSGSGSISAPPAVTPIGARPSVTLQTGDDLDDLEVVRLTVDGKPLTIRLTPEVGEDGEAGRRPAPSRPRPTVPAPRTPTPAIPRPGGPASAPASPSAPGAAASPAPADPPLVGRAPLVWTQSSASDFERGRFHNTAVNSRGDVRLAPGLTRVAQFAEQYVWSVVGIKGQVFAGTGTGGRILKLPVGSDKPEEFFQTGELQVHALARDSAGNLYAGTSPNGKIIRISPEGKGKLLLRLNPQEPPAPGMSEPDAKFVLCFATGADGTLYAGTGPDGGIYRLAPGADAFELLTSIPGESVMSLIAAAVTDGERTLFAGTADGGSIYRIRLNGDSVGNALLHDTDQSAVTGLAMDGAGNLFAALAPSGEVLRIDRDGTARSHSSKSRSPLLGLLIDPAGALYSAGASAIVRIDADGEITSLADLKRGQFTSLGWDEQGHMIAGSVNVGSVYRLDAAASGTFESTVHDARLPARWGRARYAGVLPAGGTLTVETRTGAGPEPNASWSPWEPLETRPEGAFVASPPGRFFQYRVTMGAAQGVPALREFSVYYLPRNQAPRVTLAAPVGAELWRGVQALKWSAVDPDKDTLTYQVSYSADSGRTWVPVGQATSAPASTRPSAPSASSPAGRARTEEALDRYRDQLEKDPTLTADQRKEKLEQARALIQRFLTENPPLPGGPPAPGASPTPRAGAAVTAPPPGITRQATINWDTRQVPDGVYLIRVIASDQASNPNEPLLEIATSEPFIVSNTPPQLFVFERGIDVDAQRRAQITGFALGRVSLKGAQYRLDGGDWSAIDTDDGIWDGALEHFRFTVAAGTPGAHSVEVRVVDAAGNPQTEKVRFTAK